MSVITTTRVRPADYGTLDHLLYTAQNVYREPPDEHERLGWLVDAVEHHIAGSPLYARLAAARQFDAMRLRETGDLSQVPLVSSGLFKRVAVATDTSGQVRLCTSSGTMGAKSVVARDDRTLERFVGSILNGMRQFFGESELRKGFVFGPDPEEAGDLWFAYAISLAEMFNGGEHFVVDGEFRVAEALEALVSAPADVQPVIITPPSLLMELFEWMQGRGEIVAFAHPEPLVITAGGWKRDATEAVDRAELERLGGELLGIGPGCFRDLYNMVELNTLVLECAHATKHVPPWLHVDARRTSDLQPLESGEMGLLAFLDPTPLSYPGFILSEDLGSVSRRCCACGITGEVLSLERRLKGIEERGCGLKMSRYGQGVTDQ
jgi:long-chain-fatty-acid---luciferin-component ligase